MCSFPFPLSLAFSPVVHWNLRAVCSALGSRLVSLLHEEMTDAGKSLWDVLYGGASMG